MRKRNVRPAKKRTSRRSGDLRRSRPSRSSRRSGAAIAELVGFGRQAWRSLGGPRPAPAAEPKGAVLGWEKFDYRGHDVTLGRTLEPIGGRKNMWEAAFVVPIGPWRKPTTVYVHGPSRDTAACMARAKIDAALCKGG